jgi:ribose-phosphate pyrophosphokinase
VERVKESSLKRLVVTDTIPLSPAAQKCPKIVQLSVSHLLARALLSIHQEDSISSLFEIHF